MKFFFKAIALLAVSLILFSCTEDEEKVDSVKTENTTPVIKFDSIAIITGVVDSSEAKPGELIEVYVNNLFEKDHTTFRDTIKPNGEFRLEIVLERKQDVLIAVGQYFNLLIIEPSDSMNIDFNQNSKVSFKGSKNKMNKQLWDLSIAEYLSSFYYRQIPEGPYQHYLFCDSVKKIKEKSIDSVDKEINLDPDLKLWLTNLVQTRYLSELLSNPDAVHFHDSINENSIGDMLRKVTKEDLIHSYWFASVPDDIYVFTRRNLPTGPTFYTKLLHRYSSLTSENCLIKDIVIQHWFLGTISQIDSAKFLEHEHFIIDYVNDSLIKKNIYKEYYKIQDKNRLKLSNFTNIHDGPLNQNDFINLLTKKFPNKTIFIDCYATWCGPCMKEFETINEDMSLFKEDVEFVFLCFKSEKENWKNLLKRTQLKGEHFFMEGEVAEAVDKLLNINGYPTHKIITKEGKLITNKILSLSESKTKELLNSLIED